jgi:Sulfotransferase family
LHSQVFTFEELPFFEQMWTPAARDHLLSRENAAALAAKLFSAQRQGALKADRPEAFLTEARELVAGRERWAAFDVFTEFIAKETRTHCKQVACDHTPRNVYYLREILALYPDARLIVMVRDARDVLASQKKKWLMRFRGHNDDPLLEALRLKINYHPVTTSLLWKAAITAGDKFADHPRVRRVRFEDLVREPTAQAMEICEFLALPYETGILGIAQVNSSYDAPSSETPGLNPNVAGRWKRGALTSTELFLCERITRKGMETHGYPLAKARPNPLRLITSLLLFPVKAGLALLFNVGRMQSVSDAVMRRLGART